MPDPNPPQVEPDPLPTTERPAEPVGARTHRDKGPSAGRIASIVVPIVSLAALVGFGWALGWHEPLLSVFKPELAPAHGRITYRGGPVTVGHVATWPVSTMGESALGALGPDGSFELKTNGHDGATIGEHRLMVFAMTTDFPPKSITPARYTKAATTPLRITVTSDPKTNIFELKLSDEEKQ